jgi:hypothetical protein
MRSDAASVRSETQPSAMTARGSFLAARAAPTVTRTAGSNHGNRDSSPISVRVWGSNGTPRTAPTVEPVRVTHPKSSERAGFSGLILCPLGP